MTQKTNEVYSKYKKYLHNETNDIIENEERKINQLIGKIF